MTERRVTGKVCKRLEAMGMLLALAALHCVTVHALQEVGHPWPLSLKVPYSEDDPEHHHTPKHAMAAVHFLVWKALDPKPRSRHIRRL